MITFPEKKKNNRITFPEKKNNRNEKMMLTSSFAFTCYLSQVSASLDCL